MELRINRVQINRSWPVIVYHGGLCKIYLDAYINNQYFWLNNNTAQLYLRESDYYKKTYASKSMPHLKRELNHMYERLLF